MEMDGWMDGCVDRGATNKSLLMSVEGPVCLVMPLCLTRAALCSILCQEVTHELSCDMLFPRGQKRHCYVE